MQDPYPATFQRRHHNISLGAVFFCLHVNNNLSKSMKITDPLYSNAVIANGDTNSRYVSFQFTVNDGVGLLEGISTLMVNFGASGIWVSALKNGSWSKIMTVNKDA